MAWYAHIDAEAFDLELMRDAFTNKLFRIEDHEYGILITSPRFSNCNSARDVKERADLLLSQLNIALKRANSGFAGLRLRGVAEKTNRGFSWTLFAEPATVAIRGGVAKARIEDRDGEVITLTLPRRAFAERMTELMGRVSGFAEAAEILHSKPVTWGSLNLVYETVKGLASPNGNRADWQNLIALGWLSIDESNRFYETAKHYRHGHPRMPIRHSSPMSLDEAEHLVDRLFVHLVDHLQPS